MPPPRPKSLSRLPRHLKIHQPGITSHASRRTNTPEDPVSTITTMCTGTIFVDTCSCFKISCPNNRMTGRILPFGHATSAVYQNYDFFKCNWWYVNGPPEQVMNRYFQPACPYFEWVERLKPPPGLCSACQQTCQDKPPVGANTGQKRDPERKDGWDVYRSNIGRRRSPVSK